ncbi:MAG: alkaline phosphatase family protein [Bacteroidota bacterium]
MKSLFTWIVLLSSLQLTSFKKYKTAETDSLPITGNLFIITIDGFRWQEIFSGADSALLCNEKYTDDTAYMKALYWAGSAVERRKKLMPFFWNILAAKGQLYGNRDFDNKVNVANMYAVSYPGYNEIFTGNTDVSISSNKKKKNTNINVLEYLNNKPSFNGKIVAFTSWDVFPYILNTGRNHLPINSGYNDIDDPASSEQQMINKVQQEGVYDKTATRYDQLTFLSAKEYIRQHQPKVVYLGFGETDEFAHRGRYDLYIEQANKIDKMIGELWHWVQTTPGYKNNTSFIITTDHGRGSKENKWTDHGEFIKGSSQAWLALMGPGIKPLGEIREDEQIYQQQLAQTFAGLLGENFKTDQDIAPAISLR